MGHYLNYQGISADKYGIAEAVKSGKIRGVTPMKADGSVVNSMFLILMDFNYGRKNSCEGHY